MSKCDSECDLLHYGGPYEPDCGCKERRLKARIEELEAEIERMRPWYPIPPTGSGSLDTPPGAR